MFRKYLESIAGVDIYPIISLLIFFIFFALLITYVVKTSKEHIEELSHLPLETDSNNE
ncbi:MAG: CcoQ/FixQ family Cbb3-type cytochrome c oxidase assembly chaperone [Bacteroidia bacterium]|jgi:cytochrome c oxidase cbb3-type subunit 4|nr:CcoQ/FixQ family Cbb3-type cytochrome c oxidase assembly chaperone [Bacteroidia bacterium]